MEGALVGAADLRVACKRCGGPMSVREAGPVPNRRPPGEHGAGLPPLPTGHPELRPGDASGGSPGAADRAAALMATSAPAMFPPSAPPASLLVHPRPAARKGLASNGDEAWFVALAGIQQGPYTASEYSRLLEQERVDWTTPVWREGLKDWRPARRDAILVTAVAWARGNAGDTMRHSAIPSSLTSDDTVVDVLPVGLFRSSAKNAVLETVPPPVSQAPAIEAAEGVSPAPGPKLTPSSRPAAWSSPENESFRAGLGMRSMASQLPTEPNAPMPAGPASSQTHAPRSAASLNRAGAPLESTAQFDLGPPVRASVAATQSWMPNLRSMLSVAAVAFAAGVLVAASWGHWSGASEATAVKADHAVVPARKDQAHPTPSPVARPLGTPLPAAAPLRELPDPEELRAEVRHVAPDVKRCVQDPAMGIDVDIYLDGPSGRVRDVDVRSPLLALSRVACVSQAVRQIQLVPFARRELKLMHKFSW